MAVDRPTFSESWYRVADIRARLRSTVQIYRQHYRGQMWHVVQDPSSNQFFRLNEPAYRFVALLDGRRSVSEVWQICMDDLGDQAPTQNEAIQLLGQLYTSNLLAAELPPDAEGLFKRHKKRMRREVQGYLTNLLFVRIPLFDPDQFLNRWLNVFGRLFSMWGFVLWLGLISVGLYYVIDGWAELAANSQLDMMLDPANLPLLYAAFVLIKIVHEFAHAFSCKKFGRQSGSGGEVHTIGIMFLVFTPLPYVDASSAWALRSKWHRVLVGAAGMICELGVAAIAAIIWANTGPGTVHTICRNAMFVASVSTIMFNGNPLLRYDAYYILSDLIEIPNLSQRSKYYIYYLVRRYVYGVKRAQNPAHTRGEKGWMFFYGLASTAYRVFICTFILMKVTNIVPVLGAVLAVAAVFAWVVVPLAKFVRYLLTGSELTRTRGRALATTGGFLVLLIIALGVIPVPDRARAEGFVEPVDLAMVHAVQGAGQLDWFLTSGVRVEPRAGQVLLTTQNPGLETRLQTLLINHQAVTRQLDQALAEQDMAKVAQFQAQLVSLEQQIDQLRRILSETRVTPPIAGMWIAPDLEFSENAYLEYGKPVGMVASLDNVLIRAIIRQDAPIDEIQVGQRVDMRLKGNPAVRFGGTIERILPAGSEQLPSAALGYGAGGTVPTAPDDPQGMRTAERIFEVHIVPDNDGLIQLPDSAVTGERTFQLHPGQRVVVRLTMDDRKPLAVIWARDIRQLILKRF